MSDVLRCRHRGSRRRSGTRHSRDWESHRRGRDTTRRPTDSRPSTTPCRATPAIWGPVPGPWQNTPVRGVRPRHTARTGTSDTGRKVQSPVPRGLPLCSSNTAGRRSRSVWSRGIGPRPFPDTDSAAAIRLLRPWKSPRPRWRADSEDRRSGSHRCCRCCFRYPGCWRWTGFRRSGSRCRRRGSCLGGCRRQRTAWSIQLCRRVPYRSHPNRSRSPRSNDQSQTSKCRHQDWRPRPWLDRPRGPPGSRFVVDSRRTSRRRPANSLWREKRRIGDRRNENRTTVLRRRTEHNIEDNATPLPCETGIPLSFS